MPGLQDIPGDHPVQTYFVGHMTPATSKSVAVYRAPYRCRLTAAEFVPSAAITGVDINTSTLTIYNGIPDDGIWIAELPFTAGVNAVAHVPKSFALADFWDGAIIPAGGVIVAVKEAAGTGLACPDGLIVLHLQVS